MADAKGAYIGGVPVQFKDAAARAMISDEYNSAETYARGNLCIYNGKIYEAIKETTGTWDATAWEETTLAKVNGKLNGDIASLTEKIKVTTHVTKTSLYEYIGNAGPKTVPIACVYFDGDNGHCIGFSAETASYDNASYVAWFNKQHGNGVTFRVIWIQL